MTQPRHIFRFGTLLIIGSLRAGAFGAEPAPATRPATPLLAQLNAETQALYKSLDGGVLRVQMPTPNWVNELANKDAPWGRYNLDPEVKKQLENGGRRGGNYNNNTVYQQQAGQQQLNTGNTTVTGNTGNTAQVGNGGFRGGTDPGTRNGKQVDIPPQPQQGANPAQQSVGQQPAVQQQTTGPVGNNTTSYNDNPAQQQQQGLVIVVPPNAGEQQRELYVGNRLNGNVRGQVPQVVPNNLGLVIDAAGHVLVPLYVEREAVGDKPIRMIGADGEPVDATYIGSDQQTNLTILQLPRTGGRRGVALKSGPAEPLPVKPVRLSSTKPVEGSLVLVLSPADASGRLAVWSSASKDIGVVVGVDGQVLGIARYGQFLNASACQLIADQIIRNGAVKRATLGVIITQIEKDDPLRTQQPLLGERPAVRVDQVMKDSPADKAGLHVGDLLLTLGGDPVGDIPTLAAAVAAREGQSKLQVLRGEQIVEITVDLKRQ